MAPNQLVAESPYVRLSPRENPTHRLVCLPAAGSGASTYRDLSLAMPEHVEVIAIQLPGREDRIREQPFTRMEPLMGALSRAIRRHLDLPVTFFGHSSGAMLAYEMVRAITATPDPPPMQLIASGLQAPHLPFAFPPAAGRTDAQLLEDVMAVNGTPIEVGAHPQLLEMILPAIRGDLAMCESYRHRPGPPLPWPLHVFGGDGDPLASADDLAAWSAYTTGPFDLRLFPGGHFFVRAQADSVHRAIADILS